MAAKQYDCVVLFSGGLDSILAARLLEEQGLRVLCLHFVSPFFGSAAKVKWWQKCYNLAIEMVDASVAFVEMFAAYPRHGTGKTLNPCVDCKITLLRLAKDIMTGRGASFIATGEVLGQRPMSQRADALNIIARDSSCADLLLRPLSAKLLTPTAMEISGMVDREKLLRISGRGRNEQLALARQLGITEIPSPGGGCRLTEIENARRYWPLLRQYWTRTELTNSAELVRNFWLADLGRVLFNCHSNHMLLIGRNEKDNGLLMAQKGESDLLIRLPFAGPAALAVAGRKWPAQEIAEACAVAASFAPRAKNLTEVTMSLMDSAAEKAESLKVKPDRHEQIWQIPAWQTVHEEIKTCRKAKMAEMLKGQRGHKGQMRGLASADSRLA